MPATFVKTWSQTIYFFFVATLAVTGTVVPGKAQEIACPPRKNRADQLERISAYEVMNDLAEINMFGYAGDGANPLPLLKKTLGDLRRDRSMSLSRYQKMMPGITGIEAFAFYDDRYDSVDEEVITIPKRALWCLVHDGDWVLLSDGVTHHYTQVHLIDRINKKIVFADKWPERIFLLEGQNAAGVRARLYPPDVKAIEAKIANFSFPGDTETSKNIDKNTILATKVFSNNIMKREKIVRVVEITQAEFNKVVVGIVTSDTFDMVNDVLTMISEPAARGGALLAFATIAGKHGDVPNETSVKLVTGALKEARTAGDNALLNRAAGRAVFVYLYQYYDATKRGDEGTRKDLMLSLNTLLKGLSIDALMKTWGARDYYSMGNAAGNAGVPVEAINYYNRAISSDRSFEEAYLYRAVAKEMIADHNGSLEDTASALDLNRRHTAEVQTRHQQRQSRDSAGLDSDRIELENLSSLRIIAQEQRVKTYMRLGRWCDGEIEARGLMEAERAFGFFASAQCDLAMQNINAAIAKTEKAISLERDGEIRAQYMAMLAEISTKKH